MLWLENVILNLIELGQMGFVSRREGWNGRLNLQLIGV